MQSLEQLARNAQPRVVLGAAGGLLASLALLGYLWLVAPSLAEYRQLAAERASAEGEPEAAGASPDFALAALEQQVEQARGELYGGTASVPAPVMESFVIDSLDRLSRDHGVELASVRPGPQAAVLMFDELPYDVAVRGGYAQLYDWLGAVETELRPMVVKQFEFERLGPDALVTLSLRLVAYRAREERG